MIGFTMKKDHTYIHEAEMTQLHSSLTDNRTILELKFEVDGIANKYSRVLWNLEEALGWIGGLLQVIIFAQTALV